MSEHPRLEVIVDQTRCLGSGQCLYADPAVFDQSEEDGVVILLQRHPSSEHRDAVLHAAFGCPAQAITVLEE